MNTDIRLRAQVAKEGQGIVMKDDCISRQAAIAVLEERLFANGYSNTALVSELNRSIGYLKQLTPAHPEPLTDTEQRIFLAAMAREEKVCKQTDDEFRNCREPYEVSLVSVCHEITRKVKGALWSH